MICYWVLLHCAGVFKQSGNLERQIYWVSPERETQLIHGNSELLELNRALL